ncbi:MAG: hypothetical protein IT317_10370 [Anaerolineales bacterium]|nr:hypothetical protein [Anaerolineales bacterium]
MSKYVEFPLEGGGSIVIESAEEPARSSTGFLRGEGGYTPANAAQQTFDASVEAVRKSADLLVTKLHGLSTPPDELTVTFALKASGELGGLAVAKSGAEANFNVTLKWSKDAPSAEAPAAEERKPAKPVGYKPSRKLPAAPQPPAPDVEDDEPESDDRIAA